VAGISGLGVLTRRSGEQWGIWRLKITLRESIDWRVPHLFAQ
jgi:hypothetical protein